MSNISEAKKLVRAVSPLGRLPQSSLEGLKLLQDCWDEFDVTMHLANMYKTATQLAHFVMLLSAFVIIVIVMIETRAVVVETVVEYDPSADGEEIWDNKYLWPKSWITHTAEALRHTTFALTLWTTFTYGVITLFNPRARWHHLRIHARSLESIIWAYRTRTGVFSPDPQAEPIEDEESHGSLREDRALGSALVAWREAVVHSGDLSTVSVLRNKYEPHICLVDGWRVTGDMRARLSTPLLPLCVTAYYARV